MELFKKRLRELVGHLKVVAIAVALVSILSGGAIGLAWLAEKYDIVLTATLYIMALVIVVAVVGSFTKFLNWIFIEPFKSREGKEK